MRIVAKKKDIAQNRLDGYFWIMEKVLRIRYPFRYAINLQSAEPEPTQQSLALWFPVVVKNPSVKKELCVGERYCSKSVGWILLRYGKSGFEFAIRLDDFWCEELSLILFLISNIRKSVNKESDLMESEMWKSPLNSLSILKEIF